MNISQQNQQENVKEPFWTITRDGISVTFKNEDANVLTQDHANYELVKSLIRQKNWSELKKVVSVKDFIVNKSNGLFKVQDNTVLVDDMPVIGEVADRILSFMKEDLDCEPLVHFVRKVRNNPDERAVRDLFSFLDKNKHPITKTGNFIAYKRVLAPDENGTMLDIHSRTMDNRPGTILEMPREKVDSDPNRTCSTGLHVANWNYAQQFYGDGVMLEVEVDPADVVAIPVDYNQAKMRTCKYYVRRLIDKPRSETLLVVDSSSEQSAGLHAEEIDEDEEEVECPDCGASYPAEELSCPECDEGL